MPSLEQWQRLLIVCSAILAALGVAGLAAKGLHRMWRLASKANRWLDQVLGEPAHDDEPARPGLMERVAGIERSQVGLDARLAAIDAKLAEHLEWHGDPSGSPAAHIRPHPNSGPPQTRRHKT